ncbi:MAG: RagB/SusD family nutrient uptake outer membrane protein [Chitinophagaceae bacterium]
MKLLLRFVYCCLLFLTLGCNKFLEKVPDNRALINTPQKISQLLGTAYPQANYQAFAESMSDNVTDIGDGETDKTISDPYFFSDGHEVAQDSPENYWYACYTAIAAANQALASIKASTDSNSYSAQKGEAMVARAYSHFMLVNFFAKFYSDASAASDPGIPYVTEPETVVIKQYDRKTVQYVYDMVEKDLVAGIALLDDKFYTVPKYHFNRSAAYAFAARFYLFKKDYAKVIQYANLAVPNNNFGPNLRQWNTTYNDISDVTQLFAIYSKATENANLLLVETSSWWARNYYTERYGMDGIIQAALFKRPEPLTGGNWAIKLYSVNNSHKLVPKLDEYFVRVSVNASTGTGYVMVPLFTVEEVLFNRAEAYAYTGNSAGAIADLNTYASRRFLNYNAATNNITAARINTVYATANIRDGLIKAILDYKRTEFIHEGMRWFDILRYQVVVTHPIVGGQPLTLTANDPRRVLQIPSAALLAGISLNPR